MQKPKLKEGKLVRLHETVKNIVAYFTTFCKRIRTDDEDKIELLEMFPEQLSIRVTQIQRKYTSLELREGLLSSSVTEFNNLRDIHDRSQLNDLKIKLKSNFTLSKSVSNEVN